MKGKQAAWSHNLTAGVPSRTWRTTASLVPLVAVAHFVALYAVAALLYPGGTRADPGRTDFSFVDNYWCDLLDATTYGGRRNPGRPVAVAAMVILSVGLAVLWWLTPGLFPRARKRAWLVRSAGFACALVAPCVATIAHDMAINVAGIFGAVAFVTTMTARRPVGGRGLRLCEISALALAAGSYLVWQTGCGLALLPLIQKLALLAFLIWVVLIALWIRHDALIESRVSEGGDGPAQPKRALVIGNTDGIGLALTRRLLASGAHVTGVSRRAAAPLEATGPSGGYEHIIADVAAGDYGATLRAALAARRPYEVCVYCAGIGDRFDIVRLSDESQVFRVNLVGAVETIAAIVPEMTAAGGGHFVALSSIGDEAVSSHAPSYAASKAGLSSYLAGLALALRPHGVAVSNVRFGFVDTKMATASSRPMMISAERAVDVIMACLASRRARVTYPWRMALLVRAMRWGGRFRLLIQSPPALRRSGRRN
ncbi:MAG: SDR family NAD(P)-dependent oxidoreductase [Myxococcota bacterium]|nr:SDR family NAD(P)-dependent oxidoreductase [Myxococcota bacterium]